MRDWEQKLFKELKKKVGVQSSGKGWMREDEEMELLEGKSRKERKHLLYIWILLPIVLAKLRDIKIIWSRIRIQHEKLGPRRNYKNY